MKRVDPEALYRFIRDRWGSTANIVCPEVAEPEQPKYDYHDDWTRHPDPSGNNDTHWTCNRCGACRDRSPTEPHDPSWCSGSASEQPTPSEPVIDETKPAPAADPRRLDAEEAMAVYWRGWHSVKTRQLTAAVCAVADAQLAKARVTISEAEIKSMCNNIQKYDNLVPADVCAWLRSHGVEVV